MSGCEARHPGSGRVVLPPPSPALAPLPKPRALRRFLEVLRGRSGSSSAAKPLIGFADPVFDRNLPRTERRLASSNGVVTKAVRAGVADVLNLGTALDPLPGTAD